MKRVLVFLILLFFAMSLFSARGDIQFSRGVTYFLIGDMSIVGPRPEVKKYVDCKKEDYKRILSVKPGISDYAAIEFVDEEVIMEKFTDKDKGYIEEVLPEKITLYNHYLENISFTEDLKIIFRTIFKMFR